MVATGEEQRLMGLIHRMRFFAPDPLIEAAENVLRAIVSIAVGPGLDLTQLAVQALNGAPESDPLREFSLLCRADLDQVRRTMA